MNPKDFLNRCRFFFWCLFLITTDWIIQTVLEHVYLVTDYYCMMVMVVGTLTVKASQGRFSFYSSVEKVKESKT